MVGEIVVDAHPADLAAQLHAPLHALEFAQGGGAVRQGHAHMAGGQQRRHGVVDVVAAGQVPVHPARFVAVVEHGEGAAVGALQPVTRLTVLGEALHLAPAALLQGLFQGRLAGRQDDAPLGGDGADQMVELGLDGAQIREDVRVIEFQIIEDGGARPVMDELAALVEEGGVVLVRLHHEERRVAEPGGHAEVARHATDQIARRQAGVFQNPRQHGAGGGLAVGAGHRQHPASGQHHLGEHLGAGGIGQALVEQVFHRRIAPAQGIAHHHQIRRRVQLGRVVALDQIDAGGGQLIAHGRVDVLVGAGDPVPLGPGQQRQRPHEGAADAENMNVHENLEKQLQAGYNIGCDFESFEERPC